MDGDEINLVRQLGVFQPHMPRLCCRHRQARRLAHPLQIASERGGRQILFEQCFVANHQASHIFVAARGLQGGSDFALIVLTVAIEPSAQGHAQAVLRGQARQFGKLGCAVGSDLAGHAGQLLEV